MCYWRWNLLFLRCPLYTAQRSSLLCKISAIISWDVTVLSDEHLFFILVYDSNVYNFVSNKLILIETITYIRNSGRFTILEAFSWINSPPPFSYIAYHILPFFSYFILYFMLRSCCLGWGAHNRHKVYSIKGSLPVVSTSSVVYVFLFPINKKIKNKNINFENCTRRLGKLGE